MNNPANANDSKVVWIAGAAIVAILAVVAVIAVRSSDSGDSDEITVEQVGDVAIGDVTTTEPPVESGAEPDDAEAAEPDGDTTTTAAPAIDPAVELLPRYEAGTADPAVGMQIPKLAGQNLLTGEPMVIEADGTAKVIVFLAHWCSHCQAEVPRIVEHLESTPMPDDVELVAVSTSVDADAPNYPPSRWLNREGWTAPTLSDSATNLAAGYYGLSSFPFFVVADADGNVVVRQAGEISTSQFDELVAMAQQGR